MPDSTTARQRNYALSLGIGTDRVCVTRQQLSQMIDAAKANLSGPPNHNQVTLAGNFGLAFRANATGWDYSGELFESLNVKAFVYSVYRRHFGARWKRYDETGLNEAWVYTVCQAILADSTLRNAADHYDTTDSRSKTDLWCNMGKAWLKNEAVRFVLSQLGVDITSLDGTKAKDTETPSSFPTGSTNAPNLLPPAIPVAQRAVICPPPIVVTPVKRHRRRKQTIWENVRKLFDILSEI